MNLPGQGLTSSRGGRKCRQCPGSRLRCQHICHPPGASGSHQFQLHLRSPITIYMLLVAPPHMSCPGHQAWSPEAYKSGKVWLSSHAWKCTPRSLCQARSGQRCICAASTLPKGQRA